MQDCWQVQYVLKCSKRYKVNCSILQKLIHAGLLASSIRVEMEQAVQSKLFNTSELNICRTAGKFNTLEVNTCRTAGKFNTC